MLQVINEPASGLRIIEPVSFEYTRLKERISAWIKIRYNIKNKDKREKAWELWKYNDIVEHL